VNNSGRDDNATVRGNDPFLPVDDEAQRTRDDGESDLQGLAFCRSTPLTGAPIAIAAADPIYEQLAKLTPPRMHYQRFYATREANDNMWHASQGDPRFPARLLPHEERSSGGR
jgi:hypothetical protein